MSPYMSGDGQGICKYPPPHEAYVSILLLIAPVNACLYISPRKGHMIPDTVENCFFLVEKEYDVVRTCLLIYAVGISILLLMGW